MAVVVIIKLALLHQHLSKHPALEWQSHREHLNRIIICLITISSDIVSNSRSFRIAFLFPAPGLSSTNIQSERLPSFPSSWLEHVLNPKRKVPFTPEALQP